MAEETPVNPQTTDLARSLGTRTVSLDSQEEETAEESKNTDVEEPG